MLVSTETFGRLGKPVMALPFKLAAYASVGGVGFNDGFVVHASRKLFVGLCRGNCVLCKRSLYALAYVNGNAVCAGADIPTSKNNRVFCPLRLVVVQLLLGAVLLLHSSARTLECCGTITSSECDTCGCFCLLVFYVYAVTQTLLEKPSLVLQ